MTISMGPPPPRHASMCCEAEPKGETLSGEPTTSTAIMTAMKASMALSPPRNIKDSNIHSEEVQNDEVIQDLPESSSGKDQLEDEVPQTKNTAVPYSIPEWSGPPSHKFQLEVLKDGFIIDQLDVFEKGAYMFGRVDLCDFMLEHPTISRFHAVLQFKRSGDAYLYDLGSTHGTFINKKQVAKRAYVDLHVGDVIRFGLSTRLYIFQGPPELMPSEVDLQSSRDFKMRQEVLDREASLQRARRQTSLTEGISWGMGEDAIEENEDDGEEVTWQTYKGQLTEKQEKTREKVLKRTQKIAHMKKEIDAIRAKDISQGGLTQGQQVQIARNEQRISQLLEELENLEETLNESIRESLGARTGRILHGRKKGATEDDEEIFSDEDDFYDRTKKPPTKKSDDNQSVETADTLLDKKDAILKAMEDKKELFLSQKNKFDSGTTKESEAGDVLDAYMSGLSSQLVLDKALQIEKELSTLQSDLDRITFLLKIADPAGDAAKKRESNPQDPQLIKPHIPDIPLIKHVKEPSKDAPSRKPANLPKKREHPANDKPEADKNLADVTIEKTIAYTIVKPQWLGAVEEKEVEQEPKQEAELEDNNTCEADQFVGYKDRKIVLGNNDGIESVASGLIIRKPKQKEKIKDGHAVEDMEEEPSSSSLNIGLKAEDAVALILKHKRGYLADDDEVICEKEGIGLESKKKSKRLIGPEKPPFIDNHADYESWVPPKGQSGDGRTSLNDRYGY